MLTPPSAMPVCGFTARSSGLVAAVNVLQTALAAMLEQILRRQRHRCCAGATANVRRIVGVCSDILPRACRVVAAYCRIATAYRPVVATACSSTGASCHAIDAAVLCRCSWAPWSPATSVMGADVLPRPVQTCCQGRCCQAACSEDEQQNSRRQHPLYRLAVATGRAWSGRLTLRFDSGWSTPMLERLTGLVDARAKVGMHALPIAPRLKLAVAVHFACCAAHQRHEAHSASCELCGRNYRLLLA